MLPCFPLLLVGFIAKAKATMSARKLGEGDSDEAAEQIAVGTIENMKNITTLALVIPYYLHVRSFQFANHKLGHLQDVSCMKFFLQEHNRLNSFNAVLDQNKKDAGKGYIWQGLAYSYSMSIFRIIVVLGKSCGYDF